MPIIMSTLDQEPHNKYAYLFLTTLMSVIDKRAIKMIHRLGSAFSLRSPISPFHNVFADIYDWSGRIR